MFNLVSEVRKREKERFLVAFLDVRLHEGWSAFVFIIERQHRFTLVSSPVNKSKQKRKIEREIEREREIDG